MRFRSHIIFTLFAAGTLGLGWGCKSSKQSSAEQQPAPPQVTATCSSAWYDAWTAGVESEGSGRDYYFVVQGVGPEAHFDSVWVNGKRLLLYVEDDSTPLMLRANENRQSNVATRELPAGSSAVLRFKLNGKRQEIAVSELRLRNEVMLPAEAPEE